MICTERVPWQPIGKSHLVTDLQALQLRHPGAATCGIAVISFDARFANGRIANCTLAAAWSGPRRDQPWIGPCLAARSNGLRDVLARLPRRHDSHCES